MSYREIQNCRACHGELEDVFDFGMHQVVNFGTREDLVSPLHLVLCKSCKLLQLKHTVDPDKLFRTYFYRSGINQTMRNHLQSIVEDAMNRVELWVGDIIIDIGANDGTLLRFVPEKFTRIGFEPALNEAFLPNIKEFDFWVNDYFELPLNPPMTELLRKKAKIITAIAMFYDLDDPGKFLDDVKQVLALDGLFVLEMNYLVPMLENNRVDNISAEHLCYYSVQTLGELLAMHGFEISEINFDPINGGVFRVYAFVPKDRDVIVRSYEREKNLDKLDTYHKFVKRVLKNMAKLNEFISKRQDYESIDVYGASTRGLMVMQLANLGPQKIRQAVERNPAKVGTKYNGVPVVAEETMRENPPNYLLMLAPDYLSEQLAREMKSVRKGTKLILPFPVPQILRIDEI